ncbi:MAG: hypothetical protein GJV46_03380 [Geobacter sp.]|nr:hypothetical protein [Geobacter sp.]
MPYLVSAKGNDITAWRAAADFAENYRKKLLARTASDNTRTADELFFNATSELETLAGEHEAISGRLRELLGEIADTTHPSRLKELATLYYASLYRHLELFQAAPAFYQSSMAFLRQTSSSLMAYAADQLGLFADRMPTVSLVALGPAGRFEFTPFCPLQLLLVHGEADSSGLETLNLFSHILHAGFEEIGLRIDPVVTPRNPAWRGTLADWKQRLEEGLGQPDDADIINLLRLSDQCVLPPGEELGHKLREISFPLLRGSRPAMGNLVSRMVSLSNGLGLMGNLKLERRKPETGLFCLLDHGLLPLSSAITVLTLFKNATVSDNPGRIRELLSHNELDVELAERILGTWHTLHEFLLLREKDFSIGPHSNQPMYLNPDELGEARLDELKKALESVAFIQRQVANLFSRMGD